MKKTMPGREQVEGWPEEMAVTGRGSNISERQVLRWQI